MRIAPVDATVRKDSKGPISRTEDGTHQALVKKIILVLHTWADPSALDFRDKSWACSEDADSVANARSMIMIGKLGKERDNPVTLRH